MSNYTSSRLRTTSQRASAQTPGQRQFLEDGPPPARLTRVRIPEAPSESGLAAVPLWLWAAGAGALFGILVILVIAMSREEESVSQAPDLKVDGPSSSEEHPSAESPAKPKAGSPEEETEPAATPEDEKDVPAESGEPSGGSQAPRANPDSPPPRLLTNPFRKLPGEIELPEFPTDSARRSDPKQGMLTIGEVLDTLGNPIDVAINEGGASLPSSWRYEVLSAGTASKRWKIQLTRRRDPTDPGDTSSGRNPSFGSSVPIATLFIDQGLLKFGWVDPKSQRAAEQLCNCTLHLEAGGFEHALRLRKLQRTGSFVWSLDEAKAEFPLPSRGLPQREGLYLEVAGLDDFPGQWETSPSTRRAIWGEPITIRSAGESGAEADLQLQELQEVPCVVVRCYYRQNNKRRLLTGARIEKALRDMQRARGRLQQQLNAFQKDLPRVQRTLRRLRNTTPRNQRQQVILQGQISKVGQLERKYLRGIQTLPGRIARSAASEKQLQAVRRLAQQLHQRATINFEVGYAGAQGDFPILLPKNASQPPLSP